MAPFDCTPKTPHRALTDEEVKALLAFAPPDRALWYRVALATGYRQGELRALGVRNLDPFGPSLPLAAEFCKNRQDARQPITRELADELAALVAGKGPDDSLLAMPPKTSMTECFKEDFGKAGTKRKTAEGKATFHSLRVNYINAVVQSGADLKTIMTLARHSSATMSMQTYAKPDANRLRRAAEAVGKALKHAAKDPVLAPRVAVGAEGETINDDDEFVCVDTGKSPDKVRILARKPTASHASGSPLLRAIRTSPQCATAGLSSSAAIARVAALGCVSGPSVSSAARFQRRPVRAPSPCT
jgi:hypothetical protein